MKLIPIFLLSYLSINALGQIEEVKAPPLIDKNPVSNDPKFHYQKDNSLKIIYKHRSDTSSKPAYYLNGEFIHSSLLRSLDPNIITSVTVEKTYTEVNGIKYYGKIFFKTKKGYKPDFISLADLKTKYAELKDAPTLFIIDNELIDDDNDKYMLDLNFLWRIYIDSIDNTKEGIHLNLIRIITKTEANFKKDDGIRLRGDSTQNIDNK